MSDRSVIDSHIPLAWGYEDEEMADEFTTANDELDIARIRLENARIDVKFAQVRADRAQALLRVSIRERHAVTKADGRSVLAPQTGQPELQYSPPGGSNERR